MDAWGKFEPPDRCHLLEHHCADVAACFEALVQDRVLRARFEQASGADGLSETTLSRLTALAFLHDFGKLNAGFQFQERSARSGQAPRKAGHVVEALYAFDQREICEALGLCDLHDDWGGDSVSQLLHAALSHHGRPARKPNNRSTSMRIWAARCGSGQRRRMDAPVRAPAPPYRWWPAPAARAAGNERSRPAGRSSRTTRCGLRRTPPRRSTPAVLARGRRTSARSHRSPCTRVKVNRRVGGRIRYDRDATTRPPSRSRTRCPSADWRS